ncbi:Hsp20 family protein [Rhodococcus hoagii]|nr:Hsp20 family protein [Prescottella equi]
MLRFDPFTDVDALTRSLMSNAVGTSRVPQFIPWTVSGRRPLCAHADLPGVDPGSVDVDVENGTLTLTAHRSAPSAEHVQWLASERFTGNLSSAVVTRRRRRRREHLCTYENGVLTVMIRSRTGQATEDRGHSSRIETQNPSRRGGGDVDLTRRAQLRRRSTSRIG